MSRKVVEIHAAEAKTIANLFQERDSAVKTLTAIVQMICARENIPVAILAGLDGTGLLLDVPDDPAPAGLKLDRTESSTADSAAPWAMDGEAGAKTPSDGQPAGKTA